MLVSKRCSAIIAKTKYGEPAICKQPAAGRNESALEEVAEEGEEEEEEEDDVDDVEDEEEEEEEDEEEEEGAEPAEAVSDNDKRVSENDKPARLSQQKFEQLRGHLDVVEPLAKKLKRLEEKKQFQFAGWSVRGREEGEEEEDDVDDVEDEEEEEEEGAEPAEAVSDNDKRVSENDRRARLLEQELLKRLEEKKQSLRDRSRVGKRSSSLTVEQGLLEQQQWTLQQRLVDQEFEQLRGQLDMNRVLDAMIKIVLEANRDRVHTVTEIALES